ncbi:type II secretion system F family protein [Acetohalobium arabaticum]|uniref:Type II secretion system F domain protein n=1 Tax=Acetohalobium arabaticum (strain ATCC 49924 / DSM 5501 / Z-7288) TaxID=574087 RepID=D9QTM4_ACEAZ|nr:type II secretion system F family protein [Acetohalobium arabaticum]ADL11788.1 Type II secretion system F domain protein [Acetohalobium arabaticum DSM 5501]
MLLIAAVFIAVAGLTLVVGYYLSQPSKRVQNRLQKYAQLQREVLPRREELELSFWERVIRPGLQKMAVLFVKLTPLGVKDSIRKRLILAGRPFDLEAKEFLALQGNLMAVLPGIILGGLMIAGVSLNTALMYSLIFGFAGFVIPRFLLSKKISERQKKMQQALPDVLDLLTVSVEAGLGFDSALVRVVDKIAGPISEEFERLLQEIRMGKPRRDAMRDLGERTNVEDLTNFITAIVQADKLGVSIGKVLRVQSKQIRQKRRQRAEAQAMKAPIKMLLPLVFFIFPTLFIILLGPAAIKVMNSLMGL